MATAAQRFQAAVEQRDLAAMTDLFSADVRFYSPVKFRPFEGRDMVLGLFGVLLRTFDDFHYLGSLDGAVTTRTDGTETPATVLPFRAMVGEQEIHGIDLLHFDAEDRIIEFTVMVRPQSAVHALGAAVHAGLVADGLVPAPQ
jgi:hypothetical protein